MTSQLDVQRKVASSSGDVHKPYGSCPLSCPLGPQVPKHLCSDTHIRPIPIDVTSQGMVSQDTLFYSMGEWAQG